MNLSFRNAAVNGSGDAKTKTEPVTPSKVKTNICLEKVNIFGVYGIFIFDNRIKTNFQLSQRKHESSSSSSEDEAPSVPVTPVTPSKSKEGKEKSKKKKKKDKHKDNPNEEEPQYEETTEVSCISKDLLFSRKSFICYDVKTLLTE